MNLIKTVSLVGKNIDEIVSLLSSEFGYLNSTIKVGPLPGDDYHVKTVLLYKDSISCGLAIVDRGYYGIVNYIYFEYNPISNSYYILDGYGPQIGQSSLGNVVLDYIKNEKLLVFGFRGVSTSGPILDTLITKTKYTNANNEVKEHFGAVDFYASSFGIYGVANYKIGVETVPTSQVGYINIPKEKGKIITDKIIQIRPFLIDYNIEIEGAYISAMSPINNTQKISNLFSLNGRDYITMSRDYYSVANEVDFIVDVTIGG